MKKLVQRMFPTINLGDRVNMLINVACCSTNGLSAVIQLVKLINGDNEPYGTFLILTVNLCFTLGMGKVEAKRRRVAKHEIKVEADFQEQFRLEQAQMEQEKQEQERQRAEELAAQQALEKVEQQLTASTHEQVSLPEIFAGRRQRQAV